MAALASVQLESYYDVDGRYAGATFSSIEPNQPDNLTAADLLAVTTLSITFRPAAIRRLLDESPERSAVLKALAVTPNDVSLADAGASDLHAAWNLYAEFRKATADPTTKGKSDPWVTSAKLAARKRPKLLPVRDNVVRRALGLEKPHNGRIDLQVIANLMRDEEVQAAIEGAVSRAKLRAASAGIRSIFDTEPLRIVDVAVWMNSFG